MNIRAQKRTRNGGPLRAMGGLLLCWMAARLALFEMPFERPVVPDLVPAIARMAGTQVRAAEQMKPGWTLGTGAGSGPELPGLVPQPVRLPAPTEPHVLAGVLSAPVLPEPRPAHRVAAAHNLLWMAAMQGMPLLPAVEAAIAGQRPLGAATAAPPRVINRWSGDGWLVWREGGRGIASAGSVAPVYGGSQAGVVLRYALAPSSALRPAAYLRAVHALDVAREGDLAAGVALRPFPGIPVTAHTEARLTRRGDRLAVAPAAFVSGGIDALPVAGGVTLRGYAQAGYVGGRDATGFADGSLVAEKPIWSHRDRVVGAGAGTWGGIQRGAGRFDIGPTASLRFRLGEGTARLSADYRLRVVGEAAPSRGAAVTLTAGF